METKHNETAFRPLADIDTITHRLLLLCLFTISICAVIYHYSKDKNVLPTAKALNGNYYVNSYFSSNEVSLCPKRIKKGRWQRLRMSYC